MSIFKLRIWNWHWVTPISVVWLARELALETKFNTKWYSAYHHPAFRDSEPFGSVLGWIVAHHPDRLSLPQHHPPRRCRCGVRGPAAASARPHGAAPPPLNTSAALPLLPWHRRPLLFFLAAGPFLFFLCTDNPFLPRPPTSSTSSSAPTPLRRAPRPHAAPSAASFSVCSTSPCPRCGSASRPSPQATRRGAASSGVRREGVNLRREKEQWREGRVQFNSIQQCHIHPNGCFHIRTHFNTWPDLVLGSIQYQASQYQHPNAALLICGAHMSQ